VPLASLISARTTPAGFRVDRGERARQMDRAGAVPATAGAGHGEAGGITVVGIAGDRLPVVMSRGDAQVPYSLWAEIARQVGGAGEGQLSG
jgi:hypothetical protein